MKNNTITEFEKNNSQIKIVTETVFPPKDHNFTPGIGRIYFVGNDKFKSSASFNNDLIGLIDNLCSELNIPYEGKTLRQKILGLKDTKEIAILTIYKDKEGLIVGFEETKSPTYSEKDIFGVYYVLFAQKEDTSVIHEIQNRIVQEIYLYEHYVNHGLINLDIYEDGVLKISTQGLLNEEHVERFINRELGPSIYSMYKNKEKEKPLN